MQLLRKHPCQQLSLLIQPPSSASNDKDVLLCHQLLRVGKLYVWYINLIVVQPVYRGFTVSTPLYCTRHCPVAGGCMLRDLHTSWQGWCRSTMAVCMHSISCSHPHSFTLSLMLNDGLLLGTVNGTKLGMSTSSFITSLPGFTVEVQLDCSS